MVGRKRAGGVVWFFVFFVLALQPAWSEDQQPKVAVLPFVMHGQQDVLKTQNAIDEVFVRLGAREGMKLIDPLEVQKASGGPVSSEEQARSIGSRLGAAYTVFGSFNQIGNSISIDATLVDVSGRKKPVVLLAEEKGAENLALAVGKIVQQMSIHVLSKALIADVKVRGNDRIEAEAIKREVKSKKGEILKPEQLLRVHVIPRFGRGGCRKSSARRSRRSWRTFTWTALTTNQTRKNPQTGRKRETPEPGERELGSD